MTGNAIRTMPRSCRALSAVWTFSILAFVCLCLTTAATTAKPSLAPQSLTKTSHLPHVNPQFRHPTDVHQLFFLQRTINANTVVYTAHFDAAGNLDANTPVAVYWRRFQEKGQVMPLRWYERAFGFGVRLRKSDTPNTLRLTFNGLKSQELELRQTGPFSAALFAQINNRNYRLIYAYLDVDESGLFPKVTRLRLYTNDPLTGLYVTHTIAVSGGAYTE
ncbi:DUF4833 domain-containing protein [Shimia sagamensis]|uniref:DUF4833 domain-containing protein n=1 Tax=Shimia sagamensis TaxID=1566352 RepID=A0ABY1N9K3_9RHOB|nr:DUF4833 domain-containing protein [Shimia sagamensis]SMP03407.1 protein of unknown function [Shimia sagamensis]